MRIESRLHPAEPAPVGPGIPKRGSIMDERRIVVAAGAGLVTFAGTKYGVLKQIPGLGPVPAAAVTIALGVVLAAWVSTGKSGTLGAAIEGAGCGLIAVGAIELAGA